MTGLSLHSLPSLSAMCWCTEVNLECLSVPPITSPEHSKASGSTDSTAREFWALHSSCRDFAREGKSFEEELPSLLHE